MLRMQQEMFLLTAEVSPFAWAAGMLGSSPSPLVTIVLVGLAFTSGACRAKVADALEERSALLARATYWRPPATPVGRAELGVLPEAVPALVTCRFKADVPGGTTPKFDCVLPDGEEVRVKYGPSAELHAEVAATRLLHALGFPADEVGFVRRVRCQGCPPATFATMKVAGALGAEKLVARTLDYADHQDFEWVTIERRHPGVPVEAGGIKGWTWFELPSQFASAATRTHVDALRLLAVFLAHWDNKATNQRLVCLDGETSGRPCRRLVAMIQDLGATFGPHKVDLEDWVRAPIWVDRRTCTTGMPDLPHDGATFAPVRVSEAGRAFLADRLTRLTDTQLTALFRGARFDEYRPPLGRKHPIAAWVEAFRSRARAISEGPPCPPLPSQRPS